MWRNKIFLSILALIAFTNLVLIYIKTSDIDEKTYTNNISLIRDLQRIDADWSAEALKTKAVVNKNFDSLANILPQLRETKSKLINSEINDSKASSREIKRRLTALLSLLDAKEQNIERFKSGHAILRNSIRFLPTAMDELSEQAKQNDQNSLLFRARTLSGQIYSYVLLTDNNSKERIIAELKTIRSQTKSYQGELAATVNRFLSHTQLILERQSTTKQLLDNAISIPTVKATLNLVNEYSDFHGKRVEAVQRYRLILIAYSTLLIFALIYIGLKLRSSYLALNNANTALQEMNDTLEQKVKERTRKLKDSQTQLVQSEKMAAIGQMVAGVAHEINTPLGYVHSNVEIIHDLMTTVNEVITDFMKFCEVMSSQNSSEETIKQQANIVSKHVMQLRENDMLAESQNLLVDAKYGLEQISEIVVNLKEFSRIDRSNEEEFNVNDGIESTLKIAFNSYKYVAQIVKEYGTVPKILCSPSQINQVFLNLITNAAHAISKVNRKGIIKIKTGSNDKSVFISIQDNGVGMPAHVQKHIFEPFYTTKNAGQGTGLGLSISQGIIKEHSGVIKLLSKPGIGSNFLVVIPKVRPRNVKMIEHQPEARTA